MPETELVKHINKELIGAPIEAGAYTLRPVAHLEARLEAPKHASSDMAWGYARLEPVALVVEGHDGGDVRIAITTPDDLKTRRFMQAGLLVAAVSMTMILARRFVR